MRTSDEEVLPTNTLYNSSSTTTTTNNNHGVSVFQIKILNVAAFILTLALNYISSAGLISPYGVGTVSRQHPTKITPASGAFGIWGYIYGLEGLFVVYQFFWPTQDNAMLLHGVGFWFCSACLFNSLWIITFVQGNTTAMWFSMVLIVGLLSSICKIYVNTACWAGDRPGGIIQSVALDVHISLYAGWVTVATIVNTSVALSTALGDVEPAMASACCVVMLVVALLLNLWIVVTRRDCVWGWVLTWAAHFISVENKTNNTIYISSIVVSVIIGIVTAAVGVYTGVMWFRGRNATTAGEETIASKQVVYSHSDLDTCSGANDECTVAVGAAVGGAAGCNSSVV